MGVMSDAGPTRRRGGGMADVATELAVLAAGLLVLSSLRLRPRLTS